jgi:phosphonoacetate hydrolase
MAAGVSILKRERPDLITCRHRLCAAQGRAGSGFANAFYAMMDRFVGELDAAGCVWCSPPIRHEHKHREPRGPTCSTCRRCSTTGSAGHHARHPADHRSLRGASGALGSFATICRRRADVTAILPRLRAVEASNSRQPGRGLRAFRAAARPDRRHRGDLDRAQVLGTSREA